MDPIPVPESPLAKLDPEETAALQRLYDLGALKPSDPPDRQLRYLERVKANAKAEEASKDKSNYTKSARKALAKPWTNHL